MRGSAAFRTGVAPGGALAPGWVKDELWRKARAVPSLDLRFADNKSLVDATTGKNFVTFTRASSGTFVGSDGLLQSAVTNLLLQSEDLLTTWTANDGLSRTANQVVAPNGFTTADLLAGNGTLIGYLEQPNASSNQFVSGTTYSYSVYLKKANTSTCITLLFGTTFNSGGGNVIATWNLDTGVPTFVNGATGSMTAVGNGWYRCVITDTATQTHTQNQQWLRMASANGDVYVWGAQLEQSATAGEYIPTTSAINSAPRFDHNPTTGESLGLLVEEQRTNLLLRSEEFNDASWTKGAASVSANAVVAPDNTLTADKLIEDTASNTHIVQPSTSPSYTSGATYTYSVFAKAAERTVVQLRVTASVTFSASFNLSTGIASQLAANTTASMIAFGNGWYRCSITFSATATAIGASRVGLMLNETTSTYTGDGTSGLYIWGAQLEAGAFPTSYIPTTTAAATRSADVASITGSAFSGWYRQDEGTVFCDAKEYPFASSVSRTYYALDSSVTPNSDYTRQWIWSGNTSLLLSSIYTSSGGPVAAEFNQTLVNEQLMTALAYKINDFARSYKGATALVDASGNLPVAIDRLGIGNSNQSLYLSGHIRRLTYWPARLPNNVLQSLTQ